MRRIYFFIFVTIIFLYSQAIFSQETDEVSAEMMKVWMEYMTPGPMHEMMAKNVGDWKVNTTMWMYPGAEPTYSEGTATAEMILGGRYLKMVNKGMVMGMPMEGWSLECYDNGKMEFTNIWIDNMGTGMAISKGKWNEADNTITYEGTMYDPIEKKEMPFTSLAKKLDDNNSLFEMYMEYQGQKFKSLEIKYSR